MPDSEKKEELKCYMAVERGKTKRNRVCDACVQEQRERHRKQEAPAKKIIIEQYEELEAYLYKQKKIHYDSNAAKFEELGSSIGKEMTMQSNFVYAITSITKGGYWYSPSLHGIYTTCQNAQNSARKVFGGLSKSYQDGIFFTQR